MSFEINWEALTSDSSLNDNLKNFLDEQFNSITLPSFIDKLCVSDFSMGSAPPEITIRHIGTPFEEFYTESISDDECRREPVTKTGLLDESNESSSSEDDDDDSRHAQIKAGTNNSMNDFEFSYNDTDGSMRGQETSKRLHNYSMNNLGLGPQERETPTTFFKPSALNISSHSSSKSETNVDTSNDIQFVLEIDYRGDIMIEISVNLLVNYPSAQFITLPIKLKITDLEIHSLAALAYINKNVFVSFLCDLHTAKADYFSIPNDQRYNAVNGARASGISFQEGNFVDYAAANNKERIDVIRNVKIDTEIGENEHNVLRNVGKVEKFLVEQLRNIIRDEVCWPSWVCFGLNEEE
ncbi:mitochondrial distribution and morphology protein 12 [Metschnikowia bicuspidata var. bicuspidata NRRL YB-4993]|uniref:Mitochondrial distribution and morphology protein 12 n=1 Tax=Metschnikowia bicuspidata var. bicuspidata NRRL YB-4993 TaxID=869754 RepID=A0A1A0HAN6_9ASCO|nr:mitochondrial distribution and morphology protein 12 [Metschnikowia bicuspidata var. bicuspidata NRRL YB-4993]OBA21189.1 mitochondrial distribution and morphology protein 12 [Metschnikowia bicuspidata var. bicuspidata NRRL YB-4993]